MVANKERPRKHSEGVHCQGQKYAAQIGPGAVVYKLGFKTDHLKIEGVKILLKKDVLESLAIQGHRRNRTRSNAFAHTSLKPSVTTSPDVGLDTRGRT